MALRTLTHLRALEAESIHIIREVAAEFERPVMLYSIGKDSSVMVRLAQKAFFPGKLPFPLLHIDTTYKFQEMVEFRDRFCAVIVESKAVNERATIGVAEHPRLRIAGLRMKRHGSDLEKTEAERGEERHYHGVLVEAGGDSDRRAELHSPQRSRPVWNAANRGDRLEHNRNLLQTSDLSDGEIVRVLGVEEKEKTSDQRIHRSTRWSGERTERSTSLACCSSGMARTSSGP